MSLFRPIITGLIPGSKVVLLLLLGLVAVPVSAAELYLAPTSGVHQAGREFEVEVRLDPGSYQVNAAEGRLDLGGSGLRVVNVDEQASVFSSWQERPQLKDDDLVVFTGGTTASFSEDSLLFTLRLKSEQRGVNRIRFKSGAVMAPDDIGSDNVVSALSGGAYTIEVPPEEREAEPEYIAPDGAPQPPEITSSTHPSDEGWSYRVDGVLNWELPDEVTEVRGELDRDAGVIPEQDLGTRESKEFSELEDGEWFFNLQFRNQAGWSEVATFPLRIDTREPERFVVTQKSRDDLTDPRIKLEWEAVDPVSGIDHFLLSSSEMESKILDAEKRQILTDPLPPGEHDINLRVFDRAGNSRTEVVTAVVEPLKSPVFTEYPGVLEVGSVLALRGEAPSGAKAEVALKPRGGEQEVFTTQVDENGEFVFVAPYQLPEDIYTVRARTIDQRGALSDWGESQTVAVRPPGIVRFGNWAVDALSVIISLGALLALSLWGIYYVRHRLILLRQRLDKEVGEAEQAVHDAFELLRQDFDQMKKLLDRAAQKRDLTNTEKQIRDTLGRNLEAMEEEVEKEVKDIEEELED